ncbi:proton-coupled folate transporter [Ceratitis capitata]|uniref:(Mediterranean fruit fly) hypothetical protein n=1 Tax=Ceratitis capitata TaxID=7213 RepID=A0A811VHA1_CERCA|nr:proton-coupled folate transporter [Ceratitis capitata]CAD7014374.1 unnamed protein product [Ceratitis capitata]
MTDLKEKNILDTRDAIGMSLEQLTFDTELNGVPPAYMPTITTVAAEKEEPDEPSPEDPLKPQAKRKVRRRIISMELPVFLIFLSLMLAGPVMLNQELYQTCVAVYNYTERECEPLRGIIPKTDEAKAIEKHIQPYVARITMTYSILHNVWPGILVLFIGPWSDKFGRRPVLLVSFTAYFTGHMIMATLVYFSKALTLNPWFYLLGGIPSTLVGGGCAMTTIMFCYISDISDMENKAKRMFFVDVAMGLGVVLGNVVSSYLLKQTNVTTVCLTSATLVLIGLLYIYFFVDESLDVEKSSVSLKAKSFFDIRLIRDLVNTCVAKRPNYGRAIIGCTISVFMVTSFIMHGEHGIFYLFLRTRFNVTLQQFTYYNATVITIKMTGCALTFVVFRKLFSLPYAVIAMMGFAGSFMDHLARGLADSFWQMYMACGLGIMSGITTPMLQAILSTTVPSNELGKVYSLASCTQTLSPLISAPLYTYVYNRTLNFNPGLFNFISTGLFVECFCAMFVINVFQRRVAKRSKDAETEKGAMEKVEKAET